MSIDIIQFLAEFDWKTILTLGAFIFTLHIKQQKRIDEKFKQVDERFKQIEEKFEERFQSIEKRLNSIERRLSVIEAIMAFKKWEVIQKNEDEEAE